MSRGVNASPNDSGQPAAASSRQPILGAIALVVAVGVLSYSNALQGPFVFDDYENVRDNPYLRIQELGWGELRTAALEGPSARRPIAKLTFALNYYFGADNVWGYHAVNLSVHLACGVLVFLLGLELFHRVPSALAAALVFVSHPLQTQAVNYIVQRMTCLAAMFYLAALLCYVYGRTTTGRPRWLYWAGTFACGLLAVGSKENALTLPLAILLYEWYFFQRLDRMWLRRTCLYLVPVLCVLAAIAILNPGVRAELFDYYDVRDFTMWERLLTEARVVVYYLSLVVWPLPNRLSISHDFPISHGLLDPFTTYLSLLALGGIVTSVMWTAKQWPIVSFCLVWVLLHLAIESSVIPLELVYEHRMYLPMAGVSWLAAWGLFAAVPNVRQALAISAAVVVLLGLATHSRNRIWQDEPTLWADVVAKYPADARAHNNLGSALASLGRHEEAIQHHRRALELKPGFANAHNNLGIALAAEGDTSGAIEQYLAALEADPQYAYAWNNLGNALLARGDSAGAIAQYRQAIKWQSDYADAHYNLAAALSAQAKPAEAAQHYREALRSNPRYYQAANNLGALLAAEGKLDEAVEQFQFALRLQPDYVDALGNLGSVLIWQEKTSEARAVLRRALQLAESQGNDAVATAIRAQLEALEE